MPRALLLCVSLVVLSSACSRRPAVGHPAGPSAIPAVAPPPGVGAKKPAERTAAAPPSPSTAWPHPPAPPQPVPKSSGGQVVKPPAKVEQPKRTVVSGKVVQINDPLPDGTVLVVVFDGPSQATVSRPEDTYRQIQQNALNPTNNLPVVCHFTRGHKLQHFMRVKVEGDLVMVSGTPHLKNPRVVSPSNHN